MESNDRATETAEPEAPGQAPAHPAGHSGDGGEGTAPNATSAADAVHGAGRVLAELGEYVRYYISATLDQWKIVGRNVGIYAALGIVGLLAAATVVVTAVVLLLVGLAIAIGKAFEPDQFWAGAVIVAVVVLGGLAGAVVFGMKWLSRMSRAALVKK